MRRVALIAALALPGCAADAPSTPAVGARTGLCHQDGLEHYVGRPASQDLAAEMLRVSGARLFQWVGHGMMVTMDFSPGRLRVFLTADNRVDRANCG